MRSSDRPVEFWQSTDERPWWHTQHVNEVRKRAKEMSIPELRGLAEEMKGAVGTLQSEMESKAGDVSHIRDLSKKLGPAVAFDDARLAKEVSEKYDITVEEAGELIEEFEWWKSVRGALGFIRQKHSIVVAEITRRRAQDAEQAIFDIKGKIKRAEELLGQDDAVLAAVNADREDVKNGLRLLRAANERLEKVGP